MNGKKRTVTVLMLALAVMFGLVAASVPLYSLFCRVTGYAGTPRIADGQAAHPMGQTIVIRFDASVMKGMPWRFAPERTSMTVHLGETALAVFTAENLADQPITGTATFNVTPAKAAPYVNKIQCFCFSEQSLAAGETAEMPVSFYIDPQIATDPNTDDVKTITLSYTFFRAKTPSTVAVRPGLNDRAEPAGGKGSEGKS